MKFNNKLVLCIVYVFTVFFTLYLCLLYRNSSSNVDSTIISDYVSDVTANSYNILYENVKNYNDENDTFYIYVASYKENDMSLFENMLKNVIVNNNIKNIIYINADNLKKFDYLKMLIDGFSGEKKYDLSMRFPMFIVFEQGYITDVIDLYDKDVNFLERFLEAEYD